MKTPYIPHRGDIVWIDFTPQSGHEQAGRRPALVLSPSDYNGKVGLMLCCPITGQKKGYPFEVELVGVTTTGVALADQVKSLDWNARHAEYKETVPPSIIRDVSAKSLALLSSQ